MKPTLRKVMAAAALALVLASSAGLVETGQAQAAAAPAGCTTASPSTWYWTTTQTRVSGWCIKSGDNYLVMQVDGNFVLRAGSSALWSTQTQHIDGPLRFWQTRYIAFQWDGNVVVVGQRLDPLHLPPQSDYAVWAANRYGGWFNSRPCPATKYYAQIHPAGGGQGLHVDFGQICANGAWFNNFAIDPSNVAAPGVRPYR